LSNFFAVLSLYEDYDVELLRWGGVTVRIPFIGEKSLFIVKRLDRVKQGGLTGRVESKKYAY